MNAFCFIIIDYYSFERTCEYLKHLDNYFDNNFLIKAVVIDNSNNKKNFINLIRALENNFAKSKKLNTNNYFIKTKNIEVIMVDPEENLGYAKGNNYGAKVAEEHFEFDYYIFSNNDIVIKNLDLTKIKVYFKNNIHTAILGIKQLDLKGVNQNPRKNTNIWRKLIIPNLFNLFLNARLTNRIINDKYSLDSLDTMPIEVDWVSGAFFIVRKEVFNMVNGFDQNTFLFAEEPIICDKVRKFKQKVVYFPYSEILHEHGGTTKKQSSILIENINFNSHYYYFKEYVKSNTFELIIAKISYKIYVNLFRPIKLLIKKILSLR
ncbi:glycosyltransferase family 2 protein [Bacillus sp. AFS041924]|uniref:glycosyltransferase family 2 protein n=1 Tax=Bacillus sp. AFS041924 TaxID=2033503 RepID=UPI000BFDD0E5|nr:glycosyltransferase family 2 protein [Bacillus sp. AFS041924]PGS56025.1 hypothetical protein COC46_01970 [Bacillus sp. AFS041924]